jgi:indole-3-glycerol phosphate synthase
MPEDILKVILAHKREEVEHRKTLISDKEIQARAADTERPLDFAGALRSPKIGPTALIAEVKKASPSAGIIRDDFEPVAIATTYAKHGADCLSVLTDERFFQGCDDYLIQVRSAVSIPLLRKEFIVDPYQIVEARALGADAILVIVSALTPAEVSLFGTVAKSLGMAALVEVHTEAEMQTALDVGADLIGINSRNLSTFVTDLGTVDRLARMVRRDVTLVAESGIKTPADVARVRQGGAHAILVGETLMRPQDIGSAVDALLSPEAAG